jgi:SAM-dependent methyltransferase
MTLFYGELAALWPLISPIEESEGEAAMILGILKKHASQARTLLELGCGGGHVAYYLKHSFTCHLTDLSEPMLENSRRLNPECTHSAGDMRTLDLGQSFDLVLSHDAIDYMISEEDLRAAFDTAWRHLAPGGVACFIPDDLAETYEAGTGVSGVDGADGQAVRLFEWNEQARPDSCTVKVHYTFIVRDHSGNVSTHYEPHTTGLFPRATWVRLLAERGFSVEIAHEQTDENRFGRLLFLAKKPES